MGGQITARDCIDDRLQPWSVRKGKIQGAHGYESGGNDRKRECISEGLEIGVIGVIEEDLILPIRVDRVAHGVVVEVEEVLITRSCTNRRRARAYAELSAQRSKFPISRSAAISRIHG